MLRGEELVAEGPQAVLMMSAAALAERVVPSRTTVPDAAITDLAGYLSRWREGAWTLRGR